MPDHTLILGIETSCDETSAAVVRNGTDLLSNVVATQVDLHARYGGVFPEVASRVHIESIHPVIAQALSQANATLDDIAAVAVTRGPGLAGSLLVGLNAAKGLAMGRNLPLIGVNHLEGHIYALWLTEHRPHLRFPLLVLLVSGGHTELLLMREHLHYTRLGGTIDDAVGEAFDKVGRMLGLPYPGGPSIERSARSGRPDAFDFSRAWLPGTWDFSFSGLKTAVLYELRRQYPDYRAGREAPPASLPVADYAASFQQAAVDVLVKKTLDAAREFDVRGVIITGGVSANTALKQALERAAHPLPVFVPPLRLTGDNAAMIAAAGYWRLIAGERSPLEIDVRPNWPLNSN